MCQSRQAFHAFLLRGVIAEVRAVDVYRRDMEAIRLAGVLAVQEVREVCIAMYEATPVFLDKMCSKSLGQEVVSFLLPEYAAVRVWIVCREEEAVDQESAVPDLDKCHRVWRVYATLQQALGIVVGTQHLTLAEESIRHHLVHHGALVALNHYLLAIAHGVEAHSVSSIVDEFATVIEGLWQRLYPPAVTFVCRVYRYFLANHWLSFLLFNDSHTVYHLTVIGIIATHRHTLGINADHLIVATVCQHGVETLRRMQIVVLW